MKCSIDGALSHCQMMDVISSHRTWIQIMSLIMSFYFPLITLCSFLFLQKKSSLCYWWLYCKQKPRKPNMCKYYSMNNHIYLVAIWNHETIWTPREKTHDRLKRKNEFWLTKTNDFAKLLNPLFLYSLSSEVVETKHMAKGRQFKIKGDTWPKDLMTFKLPSSNQRLALLQLQQLCWTCDHGWLLRIWFPCTYQSLAFKIESSITRSRDSHVNNVMTIRTNSLLFWLLPDSQTSSLHFRNFENYILL